MVNMRNLLGDYYKDHRMLTYRNPKRDTRRQYGEKRKKKDEELFLGYLYRRFEHVFTATGFVD